MNLTILSFSENRQILGATVSTAAMGNCQGILDGSIRRQLHDSYRAAKPLEADSEDVKTLAEAENQLLKKPEDKGE